MNKIIKRIIKGQLITASIYLVFYLAFCFITWRFFNPFEWIINLPNTSDTNRFLILFYLVFYYSVLYGLLSIHSKKDENLKHEDLKTLDETNQLASKYLCKSDFGVYIELEKIIITKYYNSNEQKRTNRKD